MTLPIVNGWIVDYRSMKLIAINNDCNEIKYILGLIVQKALFICHAEYDLFDKDSALSALFPLKEMTFDCDDDIMEKCLALENINFPKSRLRGSTAIVIIGAAAASKNMGVISSHKSNEFLTVRDVCDHCCVPVLTAAEFFSESGV